MKTDIKALAITLLAAALLLFGGPASASAHPTGPRAKNQKFGKYSVEDSSAGLVSRTSSRVTGVRAKHYKPGAAQQSSRELVAVSTADRQRITGPKAKNARP